MHVSTGGSLSLSNLKKESLVRKQRKSLAAFDHNLSILALVATYSNYGLDGETGERKKKPHRMRF